MRTMDATMRRGGFEPPTSRLSSECSAAELPARMPRACPVQRAGTDQRKRCKARPCQKDNPLAARDFPVENRLWLQPGRTPGRTVAGGYERMREYASLQRDMCRTESMAVKMDSRLSICRPLSAIRRRRSIIPGNYGIASRKSKNVRVLPAQQRHITAAELCNSGVRALTSR
jgi:hypothetical protein